jgi:hypothetical protein
MQDARFIIGIDLGTTHSALAYVERITDDEWARPEIKLFDIPQLVQPAEVAEQPLLPSFCYLPGKHDLPAGSLKLPWAAGRAFAVGGLARVQGEKLPRRLVSSAKSWLCHPAADPTAPLLPWEAGDDVAKISALEAVTRYLQHLVEAWNYRMAGEDLDLRLENQEVLITVPASFDAVARELTVRAAQDAGIANPTLIEEPQAAFYSWIYQQGDEWRKQVKVGDLILICDLGGGTTDLTLIAVGEENGSLTLERIAVGDHILLGGDNMDLALAYFIRSKFEADGHKLDLAQTIGLRHACRAAKERLLAEPELESCPITLVGSGSRLIGGMLQQALRREELSRVILQGFFAPCRIDEKPKGRLRGGLQEMGLHYASDPSVLKHIARFLDSNASALPGQGDFLQPTAILFNGGVFKAEVLRGRIVESLNNWLAGVDKSPARVLAGADYDLAVARGAVAYGLARHGRGIRIRGGTARTYYVGVESAMPAIPGFPPPIRALCIAPFGMEEGTEAQVAEADFGLLVGEPAEFRFLSSTTRRKDQVGMLLDDWEDLGIEEVTPIEAHLTGEEGALVPVRLHCKVTEIGTLELWCVNPDTGEKWKLEFNLRETVE